LISLLCLLSCGSGQALLEVTCDHFVTNQHLYYEVKIDTDGSLLITMCSSPSTGYKWSEMAYISDPTVVQQMEHKFLPPTNNLSTPAGTEVWNFKALRKGVSAISFVYSQPREGANYPSWTVSVSLIVR
jgi:inhibitor of cysteine peptidase